jgi:hypothetical protein
MTNATPPHPQAHPLHQPLPAELIGRHHGWLTRYRTYPVSGPGARREAELRLSVLAAQVEPHFLFNTLAGVRSAIATDPAAPAR